MVSRFTKSFLHASGAVINFNVMYLHNILYARQTQIGIFKPRIDKLEDVEVRQWGDGSYGI